MHSWKLQSFAGQMKLKYYPHIGIFYNLFSLTILKKARFLSSSYLSLSLYMYFQYRNCRNLLHVQNVFITKRHCMTLMSTKQRQRPPFSLSFNICFKESLLTFATSSVKRGQPVTSTFCIRVVGANSRIYAHFCTTPPVP